MVEDRSRKQRIRARMQITGEPFTAAARGLEQDVSYLRHSWLHDGWKRLLPTEAHELERVISTATMTGLQGTLPELVAELSTERFLPHGLETALSWLDPDADAETRAIAARAEAAFEHAMHAAGHAVPRTVGALAEVLAEAGVYHRQREPRERWLAWEDTPELEAVWSLPSQWREHEDQARWSSVTCLPALDLWRWLADRGQPVAVDTTIDKLADEWDHSPGSVRHALDGLLYRGQLQVQRFGEAIDRVAVRMLADHAKITIVPDWSTEDDDDGDDDEVVPERTVWSGRPWQIYRNIAADPRVGEAAEYLAMMPFEKRTPDGQTSVTWLHQMATGTGVSLHAMADALDELEQAGMLRWNNAEQVLEFAGADGPFT